jgi:ribosomal protein S18 acetylase RimI-like enzyme
MAEIRIELRSATIDDAEMLARFGAEAFRLGCPADTPKEDLATFIATELTPDRFRQHLRNHDVTILVAEIGHRIAGYLMLVRNCHPELVKAPLPTEIRKLYVHPDFHGSGVADALMRAGLALIDGGDAWLSVFSRNARAIAFYRRSGFEVIGRQTFMVGRDPQEDFVMQRVRK